MRKSEVQATHLARHGFPWGTVGLFGLLAFLAGAMSQYVVVGWVANGPVRASVALVAAALFIAQGWLMCRVAVRSWQEQLGRDVEEVGRGVQQHEAALRPQRR